MNRRTGKLFRGGYTGGMPTSKIPAAWQTQKILETLVTRMAMAAMRGQAQPITAIVIARMEASNV